MYLQINTTSDENGYNNICMVLNRQYLSMIQRLVFFYDADWSWGVNDKKSTKGCKFKLKMSKKQATFALSSTEAA